MGRSGGRRRPNTSAKIKFVGGRSALGGGKTSRVPTGVARADARVGRKVLFVRRECRARPPWVARPSRVPAVGRASPWCSGSVVGRTTTAQGTVQRPLTSRATTDSVGCRVRCPSSDRGCCGTPPTSSSGIRSAMRWWTVVAVPGAAVGVVNTRMFVGASPPCTSRRVVVPGELPHGIRRALASWGDVVHVHVRARLGPVSWKALGWSTPWPGG